MSYYSFEPEVNISESQQAFRKRKESIERELRQKALGLEARCTSLETDNERLKREIETLQRSKTSETATACDCSGSNALRNGPFGTREQRGSRYVLMLIPSESPESGGNTRRSREARRVSAS